MATGKCWICLESGELTREHKIKASDLRKQFGEDQMVKFQYGDKLGNGLPVQGIRSNHLKFKPSICDICNNSRTQAADIAYNKFITLCNQAVNDGYDPSIVFNKEPFRDENSNEYLNVVRYFGKSLGCHITQIGLPVPEKIRRFVFGEISKNCIWLRCEKSFIDSPEFQTLSESGFVDHGGLTVYCHDKTKIPQKFQSSLTVERVHFEFWSSIGPSYLCSHYFFGSQLRQLVQNSLK